MDESHIDRDEYQPSYEVTEEHFAKDTLERYAGCQAADFQKKLLLTNFPKYVDAFASERNVKVSEGSMFKVAHDPVEGVSILDFKIGSPAAALVVDLISFLKIEAAILLGMCGGLRRRYNIGEYLVPVASIRLDGTSDHYFSPEVPALANFTITRAISEVLEESGTIYHSGITMTTNIRFWEFNRTFVEKLKASKAQAIEMECATLFIVGYFRKVGLGALLLISDLPLMKGGVKTNSSVAHLYQSCMMDHLEKGRAALHRAVMHIAAKKRLKELDERNHRT